MLANLALGVKSIVDGKPERGLPNWFALAFMIAMAFLINWENLN